MLRAGLDPSRRRLDICPLDEHGELGAETAAPPDGDGLRGLAGRLAGQRVRAVIESMTGARFVHDTLQEHGWEVLIADAQKVKDLAPLACKTDKIGARVLAELSWRDPVSEIWLADATIRRERELARSSASGGSPDEAEEPHPRDAGQLRAPLPGERSVRPGRRMSPCSSATPTTASS